MNRMPHELTKKRALELIEDFCKKRKLNPSKKPRHIHRYAYAVGYAAPACLIVARCWYESEPQCADFNKENPLTTIHIFDDKIKPGDWVVTAYVCTVRGQEDIAVGVTL